MAPSHGQYGHWWWILVILAGSCCCASAASPWTITGGRHHGAAGSSESASGSSMCSHDRTHLDPVLQRAGVSADTVFASLLKAHAAPETAAVVEVGVYDGSQCLASAQAGFKPVICFEPSPQNFERSRAAIEAGGAAEKITLVKQALGNMANQEVKLHSKGGSGDHLGEVPFAGEVDIGFQASEVLTIKSTSLDAHMRDIAFKDNIYIVKIDTQGFDGLVIEGMEGLLTERRVEYVLFELWPKAMLHEGRKSCYDTLHFLTSLGYRLYELAMPSMAFDLGKPPPDIKASMFNRGSRIEEVCEWYESDSLSSTFGIWTDVLAVSPHTTFASSPL